MNETTPHPLSLFVYGTLKRGHCNHARFCAQAVDIVPAATWGRLYLLPAGYPALEVPLQHILTRGTDDPPIDAQAQAAWPDLRCERPQGNWDLIEGELMTFADPLRDLPPIDRLEGYRPRGHCLYQRVLVGARYWQGLVPAWAYDGKGMKGQGVRKLRWPEEQANG